MQSSQIGDQTHVSCIGRWIFYHWDTREALNYFFRDPYFQMQPHERLGFYHMNFWGTHSVYNIWIPCVFSSCYYCVKVDPYLPADQGHLTLLLQWLLSLPVVSGNNASNVPWQAPASCIQWYTCCDPWQECTSSAIRTSNPVEPKVAGTEHLLITSPRGSLVWW